MLISVHDRKRVPLNKPLRIGLIGAGMVSRHHLIAWASIADQARIVALADPSADNAARRADEFKIAQTFASAEAMLAACELDAVDIAAPRQMHAPLVRLAAAKRLPVSALRDNKPFETAPQDNLETLRLVEDCYRLSGWEALR